MSKNKTLLKALADKHMNKKSINKKIGKPINPKNLSQYLISIKHFALLISFILLSFVLMP